MLKNTLVVDTSRNFILLGFINGNEATFKQIECGRNISVYLLNAIIEFLEEVGCKKEELNAVCCGKGPGAFTGIRLALSIAKTMSYALKIDLYSFSSLQIYNMFVKDRKVISIDDARSYKLYYGILNKDDKTMIEGIDEDRNVVDICDMRDDYKKVSTKSFSNIDTSLLVDFSYFNVIDFENIISLEDHFTFKPSYIKKIDCEM